MVDIAIYKQMHPRDPDAGALPPYRNELGEDKMARDEPNLGDDFYMCLPKTIYGFNMQKKEWGTSAASSCTLRSPAYLTCTHLSKPRSRPPRRRAVE